MDTKEKLLGHLDTLRGLEEKALVIYTGLVDTVEDGEIRKELVKIESEEEEHIRLIIEAKKIL